MLTRIIAVKPGTSGVHSKFKIRFEHVRNNLIPSLQSIGLKPEIFDAVIGPHLLVSNGVVSYGELNLIVGAGCTGNLLSNYELWKLSVERNESVLILEDDAILPDSNKSEVSAVLDEFEAVVKTPEILYLLSQVPFIKDRFKSYATVETANVGAHISRLLTTNDLSCTAAYVVTPDAARALIKRITTAPTIPTDGFVHGAFREKAFGILVQTNYTKGFMLNDNWADWNHVHTP